MIYLCCRLVNWIKLYNKIYQVKCCKDKGALLVGHFEVYVINRKYGVSCGEERERENEMLQAYFKIYKDSCTKEL